MSVSYYHTVQSFVQFLLNWVLTGGKLVDQNTANIRASICVVCHNNKESGEVRTSGCCGKSKIANYVVDKAKQLIIKNEKTTNDSRLLTCAVCGCENSISVWIPNVAIVKIEDVNAFPSQCWKKKRFENLDV